MYGAIITAGHDTTAKGLFGETPKGGRPPNLGQRAATNVT